LLRNGALLVNLLKAMRDRHTLTEQRREQNSIEPEQAVNSSSYPRDAGSARNGV
jgi:hypothetical protein